VAQADFAETIERVVAGLEKNRVLKEKKKIVAYHEVGHAIVGYYSMRGVVRRRFQLCHAEWQR